MKSYLRSSRAGAVSALAKTLLFIALLAGGPTSAARAAQTLTWTGLGNNNAWSTPANWAPAGIPSTNDALVFPANAQKQMNMNNILNLTVQSVTFVGPGSGITIQGQRLHVSGEVTSSNDSGVHRVQLDLVFAQGGSINAAAGSSLFVEGGVSIGTNQQLVLQSVGSARLTLSGIIQGPGEVVKLGDGLARLNSTLPNTYSGQTTIRAGVLAVSSDSVLGASTAGTTVLEGSTLQVEAAGLIESVFLRGAGRGGTNGALSLQPAASVLGSIILDAPAMVRVDAGLATLSGAISGTGPLTKTGAGTLQFGGGSGPPNTYTGDTIIEEGVLLPNKGTSVTTVPGHLIIGGSTNLVSATVRHLSGFTIGGAVTVNRNGLWDLNGFEEGWGIAELQGRPPLTLNNGGGVQTGTGILHLPAGTNIVVNPVQVTGSRITGRIGLESGVHRFVVNVSPTNTLTTANPIQLDVLATLSETSSAADLVKEGTGRMRLGTNNSFTGSVSVNGGTLLVAHTLALGSTAGGTTVNSNAALQLGDQVVVSQEALTLDSTAQPALSALGGFQGWTGDIQLRRTAQVRVNDPAGALSLSGSVAGPGGLTKVGPGVLHLAGSATNSYAGATVISNGVVEVNKPAGVLALGGDAIIGQPDQAPTNATLRTFDEAHLRRTANVTVHRSGQFAVGGSGIALNTLRGDGRVHLAGGVLTLSNTVSFDLAAIVTGTGALHKHQPSTTVHVTSDSPFSGATTVFQGFYSVDGQWPNSPVTVKSGATLRGDGVVGNVTAFENGSLIRVDSGTPGRLGGDLEVGDFALGANGSSSGTLNLSFHGPHPTGGNDRIVARGAVNVTGARLSVSFAYPPGEDDFIMLIKKNSPGPMVGNFLDWPEGAVRQLGDVTVRASYVGGDGNDFIVTVTNLPVGLAGYRLAQGNGNQTVEQDECNLVFLALTNRSAAPLTVTSAVLRAAFDGITFANGPPLLPTHRVLATIPSAIYPVIPAGAARENLTPFQFRTEPTLPCGSPMYFELVVGIAGEGQFTVGFTPATSGDCSRPTGGCESCHVVAGQFTPAAVTSTRRLNFTGAASVSAPVKPCPGFLEAGEAPPVRHVLHSVTNSTTNEVWVTALLHFDCPGAPTNALGVSAYLGEFRPTQPCVNYLGDGGAGGPPYRPFSFRVPPRTNFVLVVTARETNLVCDTYAVELFGLPCPPPAVHLAVASGPSFGNSSGSSNPRPLLVSWSSAYPDYRLQTSTAIGGPSAPPFSDVANAPVLVHGQYVSTNAVTGPRQFFRLVK